MSATVLVRKMIVIAAPPAIAFRVFTDGIGTWWPVESHHVGKVEAATTIVEPRVGGRCYEVGIDGSQCDWGVVRAWEPPSRFVMGWQLTAAFAHDPSIETEVEVKFIADGTGTRVELEHRKLEIFGDDVERMRATFDSPGGWSGLLERFGRAADAA